MYRQSVMKVNIVLTPPEIQANISLQKHRGKKMRQIENINITLLTPTRQEPIQLGCLNIVWKAKKKFGKLRTQTPASWSPALVLCARAARQANSRTPLYSPPSTILTPAPACCCCSGFAPQPPRDAMLDVTNRNTPIAQDVCAVA